jgi:hypothetical protein
MLGDFKNFIDMINGGGAGRAGQRFEGGGLLSMIANAVARPYGFEERMGQVRPQARPMQPPMQAPMQPPMQAPAMSPFEMFGGQYPSSSPLSPPMGGGRTAVGPQRPLTYGPQGGRPVIGSSTATTVQQRLAEMQNPGTPPERRAQIEQALRGVLSLQGGIDMLDFGGR